MGNRHSVEVALFRNQLLYGSAHGMVYPETTWMVHVPARSNSMEEFCVEFYPEVPDVAGMAGWLVASCRFIFPQAGFYGERKPIHWYIDEPTDWFSGLARWPAQPACSWTVGVRRNL